eukprot:16444421-Heterocapsa_arctica.AAC.1
MHAAHGHVIDVHVWQTMMDKLALHRQETQTAATAASSSSSSWSLAQSARTLSEAVVFEPTASRIYLPPALPSSRNASAREQYAGLDKDMLIEVLLQRDSMIRDLRTTTNSSKRSLRRKSDKLAMVQHAAPSDDMDQLFRVTRKKGGRLTDQGCLALAMRQAMSGGGAARLGASLLEDVSQQTVNRSELLLAASLICSAHTFHELQADILAEAPRVLNLASESFLSSGSFFGLKSFNFARLPKSHA